MRKKVIMVSAFLHPEVAMLLRIMKLRQLGKSSRGVKRHQLNYWVSEYYYICTANSIPHSVYAVEI